MTINMIQSSTNNLESTILCGPVQNIIINGHITMSEYKKLSAFKYCVDVFTEYKIYKEEFNFVFWESINDPVTITLDVETNQFVNYWRFAQECINDYILTIVVKIMTYNYSIHNCRWTKRQLKAIKKDYKLDF